MTSFTKSIKSNHLLIIAIGTLCLLAGIASLWWFTNWAYQSAAVAFSGFIYWGAVRVATPVELHRERTVRYSLQIFFVLASGVIFGRQWFEPILFELLTQVWPSMGTKVQNATAVPTVTLLIIIFLGHLAFLYFHRPPSALGRVNRSDAPKKGPTYLDREDALVAVFQSRLLRLDEELRWHQRYFVDLDATIEIRNYGEPKQRVQDLVKALKHNEDAKIFTVLGVPGAGKSVALRKTCLELLTERVHGERIPIYVNLKEWSSSREWTAIDPPTSEEFSSFVRSSVMSGMPDQAKSFLRDHYEELLAAGEFMFLFDSFDEIPGILDADESTKLLAKVSDVIVDFINAQAQPRGIIASRYYRRPKLGQEPHAELEVRPFPESQIAEVIDRSCQRPDELKTIIFNKRPDLGAIAKNPFTLSLIILFWDKKREAPKNQSELYSDYISYCVAEAEEEISTFGIATDELFPLMAEVSWAMFGAKHHGLEISITELRGVILNNSLDAAIDALVAARLMRKAAVTQKVSFVHRRFHEYFLVERWLTGREDPPFESIATDSRFRDALVLYAEVSDDESAKQLAHFCWTEVSEAWGDSKKLGISSEALRAVYCLRFVSEAFRANPERMGEAQVLFAQLAAGAIKNSDDLLLRRLIVEAAGLAPELEQETILSTALLGGNNWLFEAATTSCRYLPSMPKKVEKSLFRDVQSQNFTKLLFPEKEKMFSLSVAEVFNPILKEIKLLRFDAAISLFLLAVVFCGFAAYFPNISFTVFCTAGLISLADHWFYRMYFSLGGGGISNFFVKMGVLRFGGNKTILDILHATLFWSALLLTMMQLNNFIEGSEVTFSSLNSMLTGILLVVLLGLSILITLNRASDLRGAASKVAWGYIATDLFPFIVFFSIMTAGVFIAGYVLNAMYNLIYALIPTLVDFLAVIIPTAFTAFMYLLSIGGTFFMALLFAVLAFSFFKTRSSDRAALKKLTRNFSGLRSDVAHGLDQLEMRSTRSKYLDWVDHKSRDIDQSERLADISKNPWPDIERPNWEDDAVSTRLAQLDRRWLGLDL